MERRSYLKIYGDNFSWNEREREHGRKVVFQMEMKLCPNFSVSKTQFGLNNYTLYLFFF